MAVVPKDTLKSYFQNGKEPDENKYIDLIDTMGDMYKSSYDTNLDGEVNAAETANAAPWSGITGKPATYPATTPVADSSKLGNIAAVEYLQRVSANRPGVTRLYRSTSDSAYWLQTEWTGTYWQLQGYNGSGYHGPVQVGLADAVPWSGITGKPATYPATTPVADSDKLDGYHESSFFRPGTDLLTSGDIRTSQGITVGEITTNPGVGRIQFGGNVYIAENGADMFRVNTPYGATDMGRTSNGYTTWTTGGTGHVFNGQVLAGDLVHSGATGLYACNAGNRATNAVRIWKDTVNARIDSIYAGTEAIWIGYTAGGYLRSTRIGNGNSTYGDIHADNFVNESKLSSKRNIRSYKNELINPFSIIDKMHPIKYKKSNPNTSFPDKERIGFVAEDLIKVLPEVVSVDEKGSPEGIDYGQIVPLLVLAIQDLKLQIEELKNGSIV